MPFLTSGEEGATRATTRKPTITRSWNLRLMWREGGAGEVYAYLPPENSGLCSHPNRCDGQFGFSFGRGSFHFRSGEWNDVALYLQLNAPAGYSNGHVELSLNGQRVVGLGNVQFTQADQVSGPLLPSHLVFSTFFGGDTPDYATPRDTWAQFRGFRLSSGRNYSSTVSTNEARRTAGPGQGGWDSAYALVPTLLLALLAGAPWLLG